MTGSGTKTDPYIVMDYMDLCSMTGGSSTYYKLGADIDFAQADRNPADGAIIIGLKELDGDGHTISNFFGRIDSSAKYNALFKFSSAYSPTIKNVNFIGIYLAGGITCMIDMSATSNYIYCENCRFSVKINDTQTAKYAFFNRFNLTDCEILIEGTADITKQITTSGTSGCLIKLNLTFFNKNITSVYTIFGGTLSFCGITGKICCPDSAGANYKLTENTTSNSYFALNFDNITSFSMNSSLTGVNFYDKEVMANVMDSIPSASNLYALTTEQCKSAEYLQSIDFPCISGDTV